MRIWTVIVIAMTVPASAGALPDESVLEANYLQKAEGVQLPALDATAQLEVKDTSEEAPTQEVTSQPTPSPLTPVPARPEDGASVLEGSRTLTIPRAIWRGPDGHAGA